MNDKNKLIVGILALVVIYFIFVKPEAADPLLTALNAAIGFFLGAFGAVIDPKF